MNLSDSDIKELQELAKTNKPVERILAFYMDAQQNGLKAFKLALNRKLMDAAVELDGAQISITGKGKGFDRLMTALKQVEKMAPTLNDAQDEEAKPGQSGVDRIANEKRAEG